MTQMVTLEVLEERVAKLEEQVRELRQLVLPGGAWQERESEAQIWDELRQKGVVVDPSPEMVQLATEWENLPAGEKQAVREELRSLHLDPPLSEIIHLMRGGWYPDQPRRETEEER